MLLQEAASHAPAPDADRVRTAIRHLSPTERDLLVLRFRDGLTLEQLAVVTGTTVEVVRRRLHHAAWVVEDRAGVTPLQFGEPEPPRVIGRPVAMVEEEADVGITPLLAARLVAAVSGPTPAADEHWRLRALTRSVLSHVEGVLVGLLAVAVVVPAAGTIVG